MKLRQVVWAKGVFKNKKVRKKRKKIEKSVVPISCSEIAVGPTQTKNKETQNLVKEYRKYLKI